MDKPLTQNIRPGAEPLDLRGYQEAGGYQALRKALAMSPGLIVDEVTQGRLLGRGGAGFPAGRKWGEVPQVEDPRRPAYFGVNADEMEPATMKDRFLMEGDPHQLVEGAIISAYAVHAHKAWIFLRWEYKRAAARLRKAVAEACEAGYLGRNILGSGYDLDLYLHTSHGRYMCGEAEGMLNALEGRRAIPRSKPPYAASCGLWGKPTVVNNVETVCCIPHIVNRGWKWFRGLSRAPNEGGTKIYGASGRVNRPGLWEMPLGTTVREILSECAGGVRDGHRLRAFLPGGASSHFLTDQHLDVSMDFGSVDKAGSRLGTGTMVVIDDKTCLVGALLSLQRFFARESCGWCTPCREGLPWVARALEAIETGRGEPSDIEVLEDHARWIVIGSTFCALAPGAMFSVSSALKHFREDFERHVREKRCPWR
jgi:NADH-quinone oxidoreductase subunit F